MVNLLYKRCCWLHTKTGLWVSVNPWGENNTQFGLARWNAHRLWHLCLWMWTSPLQYWRQFKVNVLTPWLWIVSIHVIPFILNMCYIWSWPWSYTLLLTFNNVDTVVYVKFACELVFVHLPVFVYMFMLLPLSMWKLPVEKKNKKKTKQKKQKKTRTTWFLDWGISENHSHLQFWPCIYQILCHLGGLVPHACLFDKSGARGPFYQHGLTLIPTWISDVVASKVWDEIIPLKFGNG